MAQCEQYGKYHEGTYGSGRFCSRSCSNRWVALNQSDEAKRRKVEKGKNNLVHDGTVGFCAKNYWTDEVRSRRTGVLRTDEVRSKLSKSMIKYYEDNPDQSSRRQKISASMKIAVEKGRRPGYLSLKGESYPERYWSEVLSAKEIPYIREYKVIKSDIGIEGRGCYFLDFLLPGNIDLEIDGSQHYGEKQKLHDEVRDKNLIQAGYKVYRVRWRNPRIHPDLVKDDIKKFISWYILNVS